MEFEEYVAARRGRLVERAQEAGLGGEEATELVDRLLDRHRRLIGRRADPHPDLVLALEQSLPGPALRPRRRRSTRLTLVGAAAVVAVVAVGAAVGREPEPVAVPGLFGRDVAAAEDLLSAAGFGVDRRAIAACQPSGKVVSTQPAAGSLVDPGATVTLQLAVPSDAFCMGRYPDLRAAWEVLDFLTDRGPAPDFAPVVDVVAGDERRTIPAADAAAGDWIDGQVATALREALASRRPVLTVGRDVPQLSECGTRVPPDLVGRPALTVRVAEVGGTCGVTLHVYRTRRDIDAVVLPVP